MAALGAFTRRWTAAAWLAYSYAGIDGLARFNVDGPVESVDLDNVVTLGVNTALEVEVPANDIWALGPCASLGYGEAVRSSNGALSGVTLFFRSAFER